MHASTMPAFFVQKLSNQIKGDHTCDESKYCFTNTGGSLVLNIIAVVDSVGAGLSYRLCAKLGIAVRHVQNVGFVCATLQLIDRSRLLWSK